MKANFKKFDDNLHQLAKSKRMSSMESDKRRILVSSTDLKQLKDDSYESNQKLLIFNQLLHFDNWPLIETWVHHIEPIRVACYPTIAHGLCNRVGAIIYGFYKNTFHLEIPLETKNDFRVTEIQSFDDIPNLLFPVLYLLGPYIHVNVDIYKAVLILLNESIKKVSVFLLCYRIYKQLFVF